MRHCLIVLVLCSCAWHAHAADSVRVKKAVPLRAWASIGGVFGVHSKDFFASYKKYLGGPSSTFDVPYILEGGMSSYVWPHQSLGVSAGYYRTVMREDYTQYYPFSDTSVNVKSSISQDYTMSTVPVLVTYDYYPIDRQFATYVGGGVGVGFVNILWKQGVYGNGTAATTTNYDGSHIVPAFMIRTGISLGWDKERTTKVAGALTFEVRYTYMNVRAPLFASLAPSLPNAGPETQGDYVIQAGGLGLHLGVSVTVQ